MKKKILIISLGILFCLLLLSILRHFNLLGATKNNKIESIGSESANQVEIDSVTSMASENYMADDETGADNNIIITEVSVDKEESEEITNLQTERKCQSYEHLATDELILNPDFEYARSVVKEYRNKYGFQGTVLIGVGDEIVYTESFGKANQWEDIDNTNTTRYGIASITKSFTAAAVFQLYEEGKLDINDTIDKYFPDYSLGKRITILQLLQMRSGLIDYLNDMDKFMTVSDSKAIYESFVEKEDYVGLDEYPWSREDILKNLYNNELTFEPDEKYEYCNTNYYLLGLIVEQVSGMEFEEYVSTHFFEPCYMTSSNMHHMDTDPVGYIWGEGFVLSNYSYLFSVGSIYANVFDVYSWIRNLSKGNVVSADSFAFMTDVTEVAVKDRLFFEKEQEKLKEELGSDYVDPEVDSETVPAYYCCGLQRAGSEVYHSGYIDGFWSYMTYNLDSDVTILIFANTSEERRPRYIQMYWDEISKAVAECLSKAEEN